MRDLLGKLSILIQGRERWIAAGLLVLMIGNAALQLVGVASVMPFLAVLGDPQTIQQNEALATAFDGLGFESTQAFLYLLGILAFLAITLGNAFEAATKWVTTRYTHMLQYRVSQWLMSGYLRRPYVFFVNRNSGDLAKTVLEESRQTVEGAVMPCLRLVSQGLVVVLLLGFLLLLYPVLTLFVAVTFAVVYGGIYFFARHWLSRIGSTRVRANQQRFVAVNEAFAGAKEIRLLGREGVYLDRYQDAAQQYARTQANASILSAMPIYAIEAFAFGGIVLLVLFLMGQGGLGQTLPIIGAYALAAKRLVPAFQAIFNAIARLRFTKPALDHLVRDLRDDGDWIALPDPQESVDPLTPRREIAIQHVTYRYPNADEPALQDLDLRIPAYSRVGLVGPSGAGKSTLVDVLLGLLEPEQGRMKVDGEPITAANMRSWQAAIGYVPQHIFLADTTVRGNIALGIPESRIDQIAVERAARMANLDAFVREELPNGYDTVIGERGLRLSGGQRQRIGIARALYHDPPLLVLDEATSALDNATERVVMDAIYNLGQTKTVILIAHRLSTVQPCDRIFVLSRGRLVEEGTWEELYEGGAEFRKLAAGA
ncbi:ABC transporter ATP-binding protein/permease [Halorhodospira sp. 9621]|uniref:ABC transporter ATP-binding protein n=1 Tax=Halorhodospira sp. 9621 TaxID=2899135 RepID=UPI001EE917B8|nr:ABC transporter ATP-binding protein [Halorhodospira sp. 9621]MCG5533876.1 ABC transporter ATP-binding protein/permease [Halorhodospira sp. 9621]